MRSYALVAAVFALAVARPLQASEESAAAFVKAVLGQISVKDEPCRETPEGAGPGSVWTCAKASSDFETFSTAWDAAAKKPGNLPVAPKAVTGWQTQVGGSIRWYAVADKWVVVAYDTASRQVLISYSKDKDGVFPIVSGVVAPKRLPQEIPSGETRRDERGGLQAGAQGVVVLNAVVRGDGTVSDVEVLGCMPRHRGLEQAAVRALKKWRYEPGTVDGSSVDVAMTATFTYGPGGSYRAVETNGYKVSDAPTSTGLGGGGGGSSPN